MPMILDWIQPALDANMIFYAGQLGLYTNILVFSANPILLYISR